MIDDIIQRCVFFCYNQPARGDSTRKRCVSNGVLLSFFLPPFFFLSFPFLLLDFISCPPPRPRGAPAAAAPRH